MEILGYISAIFVGLTLGLIGGGGSILTVPILVYLMNISPVIATAYSLFVVGVTALIGSYSFMRKGLVSYITAIVFAAPTFTAVFLTRRFIIRAIPEHITTIFSFDITKNIFIMIFFALLMLASSISMIADKRSEPEIDKVTFNYPLILLVGVVTGILTGLVGAGGGFLIIPALVLLANLPMKLAVGTSLLIIAVNSLIGFSGDLLTNTPLNFSLMIIFTILAIGGIILGSYLSNFIQGTKLKPAFGWFTLIMSAFILIKEFM